MGINLSSSVIFTDDAALTLLMDCEELVFWAIIRQKYPRLYQKIESKCLTCLIPCNSSIKDVLIDEDFIKTHIFYASPMVKDHFISLNGLDIEICGTYIKIADFQKYGHKFVEVKINGEELFYNRNYQPFHCYLLEHPLIIDIRKVKLRKDSRKSDFEINVSLKYEEICSWISSDPQNSPALEEINHILGEFCKSYVILKGYLDHSIQRIKEITNYSYDLFVKSNPLYFGKVGGTSGSYLFLVIANYVSGKLHEKIFDALRVQFKEEDDNLARTVRYLAVIQNPLTFGLNHKVDLDIKCLKAINEQTTAMDKISCIRDFLSKAISAIASEEGENLLTTDDFIPIICFALVRSQLNYPYINALYMEKFMPEGEMGSEFGYLTSTFFASLEYLKSPHLEAEAKKEIERKERKYQANGKSIFFQNVIESQKVPPPKEEPEVDKIVPVDLISTSPERKPVAFQHHENAPQIIRKDEKPSNMGSFLANLLNDDDDVSSGFR